MSDLKNNNSCIILTRVSTNQQDFTAQKDDLNSWANSLGYTNIKEISTKESGFKTFDLKDGFKQVMDYINENKECRTILVTELSRLSRRRIVLEQIKHYLTENKIQLLIKDISFSLFDIYGFVNFATDITFSIFANMAENEMITKKIRGRRELNSLQSKGYSITGKRLFGYNRLYDEAIKKNKFIINEIEANEIKIIYNWYLYGVDGDKTKCNMKDINIACIAKGFSSYLHSKRNVTKTFSEQAYTGHKITNNLRKNTEYWSYGDKTKERYVRCSSDLLYPRILSDELFNAVQEKKLKNNTTAEKSNKHITLLAKLIKCPICGLYLGGNYRYRGGYVAHNYRCTRRQTANNCTNKSAYSMPLLDSVIWSYIKSDITNLVDKMRRYYSEININNIINEIENINLKIDNLDNNKEHESNIYRIMSNRDKEKALKIFSDNIASLDKKIDILKNQIDDKNKLIEQIEYNRNENENIDIENKIYNIENDKSQLKKYINLFVKEINVLYNNISYMVLKVSLIDKLDTYDLEKGYFVNDDMLYSTYLVIDKHDNNRIKVRNIDDDNCVFENNCFEYNGNSTSIDEIFCNPCIDTLSEPYLSMNPKTIRELNKRLIFCNMREVHYERLKVY